MTVLNRDFLQLLTKINNNPSKLFCIKKKNRVKILSKEFFSLDKEFVIELLCKPMSTKMQILSINENSAIYKNHISRLEKGELVWQYNWCPGGYIEKTSFIKTRDNTIQVRKNVIGEPVYFVFEKDYLKDYVKGISMRDYMKGMSGKSKKEIIEKYFNFVFENYENPETKSFPGWFLDMSPNNIIINELGFNFIDTFMQQKGKPEIAKEYIVYCLLYNYNKRLYRYFIKKYNLPDNSKLYLQERAQKEDYFRTFCKTDSEVKKYFDQLTDDSNYSEQYIF